MCGPDRAHAMQWLSALESATQPAGALARFDTGLTP
jgi:hypothetical protein